MMELKSINPKNNHLIRSWDIHGADEIISILEEANKAYLKWKNTDLSFRLNCLDEIANLLRENSKEYGIIMADEMGKPLSQGISEVEKCAWLCDYYKENAKSFLRPRSIDTENFKSLVTFQPLGLILGIMPWNFPFWQVFRFAIPSLTVGNGIVLKHASNVQGCANAIEKCFLDAGYYENIFCNLRIPGKQVASVIENHNIAAVTLTGSTPAGQAVAKKAGECLKKTVLELGGSDPYVILDDADIENAVDACIAGRILNNGQSCIAAKRLIVTRSNSKKFTEKLKSKLSLKIMGDPLDDVDIGPMVSIAARDEVDDQVQKSISAGAKLNLGGKIQDGEGAYYPLTLLSEVRPGMPAFDEEIFGPVFTVITADDENDAIELANKSEFGLGSAIFTSDVEKGENIAKEKLQSGACFVNDFVKSDPRLPFGGIKMSGYGRELSDYGMMEFVNIKTIVIKSIVKES
tara:strand:- start:260 stop:1645 length:1386 start_codon:yes stop_codon:yes gene_type:complete